MVRGLAATLIVAGLVGGIPWLLWRLAGWPLPHSLPTLAELRAGLTQPLPDDLIAKTLVTLAWAWWAHFLVCLAAETVSAVRGRMPMQVPGGWLSQAIAARLIGAILLMSSPSGFVQASAVAAPATAISRPVISALGPDRPTNQTSDVAAAQAVDDIGISQRPVLKPYVVQGRPPGEPRDTLWGIAERHLGDPLRWPEIWELNQGRPLPNPPGGRFADSNRIWPGQELLLPPDAVGLPPGERPEAQPPPVPRPS